MARRINKAVMQMGDCGKIVDRIIKDTSGTLKMHLGKHVQDTTVYCMLAMAYWVSRDGIKDIRSLIEYVDHMPNDRIKGFLNENVADMWHVVLYLSRTYTVENLRDAVSYFPYVQNNESCVLSKNIASVVADILTHGGEDGFRFADLYFGYGELLSEMHKRKPEWSLFGMGKDSTSCIMAEVEADMDGAKVSFEMEFPNSDTKFDRIFCNLIRHRGNYEGSISADEFCTMFPGTGRKLPVSDDTEWNVAAGVICHLADGGRAVVAVPDKILENGGESRNMRRKLIESGCIEAVVSVPMDSQSMIPSGISLLVLSKNGCGGIRITDIPSLKAFIGKTDYKGSMGDVLFSGIRTKHIPMVSPTVLAHRDYVLSPLKYLYMGGEDTVTLGSIMTDGFRGTQICADKMEKYFSNEPTDCQYVTLGDIHDGMISGNMQYVKNIDKSMKRHIIHDRTLVIARSGNSVRTAVVSGEPGQKFLPNGNLFAIEVDENKANPYYIKAYFESDRGVEALSRIMRGSIVRNIHPDELKELEIPMPPLEEQKCFEKDYRKKLAKISAMNAELDRMRSELHDMYENRDWSFGISPKTGTSKQNG